MLFDVLETYGSLVYYCDAFISCLDCLFCSAFTESFFEEPKIVRMASLQKKPFGTFIFKSVQHDKKLHKQKCLASFKSNLGLNHITNKPHDNFDSDLCLANKSNWNHHNSVFSLPRTMVRRPESGFFS